MLDVVTCYVSSEEMFVASSLQVYVFSLRTRVAADGVQETFKIATCSEPDNSTTLTARSPRLAVQQKREVVQTFGLLR